MDFELYTAILDRTCVRPFWLYGPILGKRRTAWVGGPSGREKGRMVSQSEPQSNGSNIREPHLYFCVAKRRNFSNVKRLNFKFKG